MMRNIRWLLLFLFVLSDLAYSFVQYYHTSLDGDIASVVVPAERFEEVMSDPFGTGVLLHDKIYAAPNRFFAHWTMAIYFRNVPLLFQKFLSPITSVYASSAFSKLLMHLLLLCGLSLLICTTSTNRTKEFILGAVLITPLFQTNGYNGTMGIVLQSISYSFFYSLPMGLLLVFFWPFFKADYHKKPPQFSLIQHCLLLVSEVFLALNGPLIPAIVIIICPIVLWNKWWRNYLTNPNGSFIQRMNDSIKKMPPSLVLHFGIFIFLSGYSIWIGRNNAENLTGVPSLEERYRHILPGLFGMFTNKLGLPLLFFMLIINTIMIRKGFYSDAGARVFGLVKWASVFSSLYIILLPFGGYRLYRPDIVRFDTMMPVILALMLVYGITTMFLLKNITQHYRMIYVGAVVVFSLIFTLADGPQLNNNQCERNALNQLSSSLEKIQRVDDNCLVMSWEKISDPKKSELNSKLIQWWGITRHPVLYYQ